MKKLLGLLVATGLVASTGTAVIACDTGTGSHDDFLGEVSLKTGALTGTVEITIPAFVEGKTSLDIESESENSLLEVSQSPALASDNTKTVVTVKLKGALTAKSSHEHLVVSYNGVTLGEIEVNIAKETGVALDSVLKVADLGSISAANAETILAAAVAKNASLVSADLEVTAPTDTKATITVKSTSTNYIAGGLVEVSYTVATV